MEKLNSFYKNNTNSAIVFSILLFILNLITVFTYVVASNLWYLIIIMLIVPLIMYSKFIAEYITNKQKNLVNKSNSYFRVFMSFILGAFTLITFITNSYENEYAPQIFNLLSYLGYAINLSIFAYFLSSLIRKINLNNSDKGVKKWELLTFMIFPLIIGILAFLSVYPGAMSPDSIYVWTKVAQSSYNNMHPLFYMLFIKLLTYIWNYPAIISIFQVLFISFTFGYMGYRLKEIGLNTILSYLAVFIVTIIPTNLYINVALWKDIPYTMALILCCIETLRIFTNKEYFSKPKNLILLGVFSFIAMACRHNGLYVMALYFIILTAYFAIKRYFKIALKSLIIGLAVFVCFIGGQEIAIQVLGDKYDDTNEFTSVATFSIPIQGLIAIYNNHYDELDVAQQESLKTYLNIDGVIAHCEEYNEGVINWQFYGRALDTANAEALSKKPSDFMKTYIEFAKLYPGEIASAYMKSTAICWSSLEYGYTSTYTIWMYTHPTDDYLKVEYTPIFKGGTHFLNSLTVFLKQAGSIMVFWRPAFVFMLLLLLIISNRNVMMAIMISLPALINHAGYFASIEGQCTRYFYVYYTLFVIMLFFTMLRKENIYVKKNNISENKI